MSTPTPITPIPIAPATPAPTVTATGASIGASIATALIYWLSTKGLFLPAGAESALGSTLTILFGFAHAKLKAAGFPLMLLFVLFLIPTLPGCALFTPAGQPFLQGGLDAAVAAAVQKGIPAAQIKSIAQQILAADKSEQVTLAAIDTLINSKVAALHLPPGDQAAAAIFASTIEGFLAAGIAKAGTNVTLQAQVDVALVCNDLILATALYGA